MSRVVLGISGGIAAYKACELLRRLSEAGHDVTVVPTDAALNFVGATTWAALSGNPEIEDYVRQLEQAVDAGADAEPASQLPRAEDVLLDIEHFLRERREDNRD